MFKKILIPTDGSSISNAAAHAGIEFATQINAEIVGIFVAHEYHYPVYVEIIPPSYPSEEEYNTSMLKAGETYFSTLREEAATANLKFSGIIALSDATAQQIVRAAEENGCDMIFMGSHGRSGWGQLLLGSVTTKVLSLCKIPVMVYRSKDEPAK